MATKTYPGKVDEDHPELFDLRVMPTQPTEQKAGQLPEGIIKQFFEEVSFGKQAFINYNFITANPTYSSKYFRSHYFKL